MSDITWTNETRRLDELVPWEHNPKRMTKKAGEGLRISLDKFGLAIPLVISPNNDLYDGHQRQPLLAMMKEYGPDAVVDVRVSSRVFTDDERREFVIRLRQNQAGWDFDMLPNLYDKEELLEWGFDEAEIGMAFVPDFDPVDESTQPRLDQKAPVTCPHCGMEFVPE